MLMGLGRAPSHLSTLPLQSACCKGDISIRESIALSSGSPAPLQSSSAHILFSPPPSGLLLSLKQGHVRRGEGLSGARARLPPLILLHLFLGPSRLAAPLLPPGKGTEGEAIARKETIVAV